MNKHFVEEVYGFKVFLMTDHIPTALSIEKDEYENHIYLQNQYPFYQESSIEELEEVLNYIEESIEDYIAKWNEVCEHSFQEVEEFYQNMIQQAIEEEQMEIEWQNYINENYDFERGDWY